MPEYPELFSFDKVLHLLVNQDYKGRAIARIQLHCAGFAIGSSKRAWTTATVDTRDDYDADSLEPIHDGWEANLWDARRAKGQSYEYLLRPTKPGPFFHRVRGKHLAVGCGYHTAVIHFGLEAHPVVFKRQEFEALTRQSVPGENPDPKKAELLRRFIIPEEMISPWAKPAQNLSQRSINILLSVHFENHVWALVDFSRLARFHITSYGSMVDGSDFEIGSKEWDSLFSVYGDGPDWKFQTALADSALMKWRSDLLSGHIRGMLPIVTEINVNNTAFAGIGRHLANDLCHCVPVHPLMPAIDVCHDEVIFGYLRKVLPDFMKAFTTAEFLSAISPRSNDGDERSLYYRWYAQHQYRTRAIKVFRLSECYEIEKALYCRMAYLGYLDIDHTLGKPYDPEKAQKIINKAFSKSNTDGQSKRFFPVYHYDGETNYPGYSSRPIKTYTVFSCQPHPTWIVAPQKRTIAKDIAAEGYRTTLGPGEFHNLKLGMPVPQLVLADLKEQEQEKPKRGRPAKKKSAGRPGAVPKPMTAKEAQEIIDTIEKQKAKKAKYEAKLPEFQHLVASSHSVASPIAQNKDTGAVGALSESGVQGSRPGVLRDVEDRDVDEGILGEGDEERIYALAELGHKGVQLVIQEALDSMWKPLDDLSGDELEKALRSAQDPAPRSPSPSPPPPTRQAPPSRVQDAHAKTKVPPPAKDDYMWAIRMRELGMHYEFSKLFDADLRDVLLNSPEQFPGTKYSKARDDYIRVAKRANQIMWSNGVHRYIKYPGVEVGHHSWQAF